MTFDNSNSITFLGTGGGRFVILSQRRYSGGLWLDFDGTQILLDPGPGALIRALQFHKDVSKLDAVFVSHNHLDHYNDAEVIIEGMTLGMKRSFGTLVASEDALEYVSDYHKNRVNVIVPKINEKFTVGRKESLYVEAIPTYRHAGCGFKFFTSSGIVTYTADTGYSDELIKDYAGSKILILNVIFPGSKEIETHLNTKSALKLVRTAKPELAVIQHFGIQMLNANPEHEAEYIERESGIKTIAAKDGMTIHAGESGGGEDQLKLTNF
jgi:ribonuclease BN (tRNA processing enzyme)